MDIDSDEESSSIFKQFSTRPVSKENANINKSTENDKVPAFNLLNNGDFDDCSRLPDGLKNSLPSELIGKPLEDIDPLYSDKETFVVVNENKQLFRFSSTNALWIFTPLNTIRSTTIRILVHPLYAKLMIAVILAFCILNATTQPRWFDLRYFLIVFLLEFLLKIISQGVLLSPFSYFRNGWNILDFVLNILLLCGTDYLAELRILKIISYSLNLRKTIRLYWSSCKLLRDLVIYISFIIAIIATFFLQVYMGVLTQGCVKSGFMDDVLKSKDEVRLCGNSSGSQSCPDSYVCIQGSVKNPDFGYTNFDSIFGSLLSTFRLITRDFWENLLHLILATAGPWHIISFIGIIFIVSYQYLSLVWGQIAVSYNYKRFQRWENNLIAEDVETDDTSSVETSSNEKDAGCWSKLQRFFFFIIYNPYVVLIVIICIILNTLCMALDHHNMPSQLEKILSIANYFFVLVFVVEAIFKLLALGVVRYFKDEWNTFDFVVTLLGAIELALEGVQGLSVFRSFRLLRPLRLGKIVPAFDLLLTRMQHLLTAVAGQTVIFFMGIYIFVLFGCRQFGQDYVRFNYDEADEFPRYNFTDIMHSFMVVFRALCGEWIETMFMCLQVASNRAVVFIYYFLMVLISSFQVMHIFTALLFTNDDSSALSSAKSQQISDKKSDKPKERFQLTPFLKEKLLEPSIKKVYEEYNPSFKPKKDIESVDDSPSAKMVTKAVIEDDAKEIINVTDTSIPIEPISNNVQETKLKLNKNKYFKHCVTLSVLASSLGLAAGYSIHADSHPIIDQVTVYFDFIFIGLLSIELMTKLFSRGWKYNLKDIWYWVDLFNLIIAVCGMLLQNQALQVLGAFRPLSLVSRCIGLQAVANTIFKQMWFLSNTILVCLAFWLIFAIMGVQLFGGKFYHCIDRDGDFVNFNIVNNRTTCEETYHSWNNSFMNFNNVLNSYSSLLEVSTFKGWIQIISDAVDSRGVNDQPIKEANLYMFLYFVIFVICGVFLCVNVLVGILVQHMLHFGSLSEIFDQAKGKSGKSSDIPETNETIDSNPLQSKVINFVRSPLFEKFAFGSCILYFVVLMCDHYNASGAWMTALDYSHLYLIVLLVVEFLLRCYAYRKELFISYWNRFDLLVVIFTIIQLFMSDLVAKYLVSAYLLRIIRIFRFYLLISSLSKTIECSGKVICRTWKTVVTLYSFLFLIICVYALIGMALYKGINVNFDGIEILNFDTFGQSLILLIQMATGAGWDGLYDKIHHVNLPIVTIYMYSFLYISFTILLNVIVLIALEFYKEVTAIDDDLNQLKQEDLNDFNEKWNRFAQNDHKYMPQNRLNDFFNSLDETSALRPPAYDPQEFRLLGIQMTKDNNYSRSALLIALNRIRLNNQQ